VAQAATSLARAVLVARADPAAAVVAEAAREVLAAPEPLVARVDLPQPLSLVAAAAAVAQVDVAAAVVAAVPTALPRSATAQAVDAARNGKPASRTIFRIRH
jgi:hypothetical protein